VGIGQVRLSTAAEVEKAAPELFGDGTDLANDTERTALIKRLAADDWSLLYAAQYLAMLAVRFPADGPVDQAIRYTGADPDTATSRDPDLYNVVKNVLGGP
jgi:hypothetical protein